MANLVQKSFSVNDHNSKTLVFHGNVPVWVKFNIVASLALSAERIAESL